METISNSTTLLVALTGVAGFMTGFVLGLFTGTKLNRDYNRDEVRTRERQTIGVVTTFFLVMTASYTLLAVLISTIKLDPIALSVFVAGALGQNVGGAVSNVINKGGKK